LDEASQQNFTRQDFMITPQTDRMGYRLNNQPLFLKHSVDMVSSPVDEGTVQLLPNGHCIILAADHQTTGGYPRIASVIKADLPKLAQAKPGQAIRFILVSMEQAEDELIQMRKTLDEIKKSCYLNLKKFNPS
jgi:antagonist of KipI